MKTHYLTTICQGTLVCVYIIDLCKGEKSSTKIPNPIILEIIFR